MISKKEQKTYIVVGSSYQDALYEIQRIQEHLSYNGVVNKLVRNSNELITENVIYKGVSASAYITSLDGLRCFSFQITDSAHYALRNDMERYDLIMKMLLGSKKETPPVYTKSLFF